MFHAIYRYCPMLLQDQVKKSTQSCVIEVSMEHMIKIIFVSKYRSNKNRLNKAFPLKGWKVSVFNQVLQASNLTVLGFSIDRLFEFSDLRQNSIFSFISARKWGIWSSDSLKVLEEDKSSSQDLFLILFSWTLRVLLFGSLNVSLCFTVLSIFAFLLTER